MIECEYNKAGDIMKKRFKSKKSSNTIIRMLLIIIVLGIFYLVTSFLLTKVRLFNDDQKLIRCILGDANKYLSDEEKDYQFQNIFLQSLLQIDLNNPITILQKSSYYIEQSQDAVLVYNENYTEDILPVIKEEFALPLVYIYNTHPTEGFVDDELSVHNIEPTIRSMADVLKQKLEELGVPTEVERGDVSEYLKEHNLNYNQSYDASRYLLEEFQKNNSSVKLYIDLHRDGVDYKNSVTTINNVNYAKVMFVIGGNQKNYESTLKASKDINSYFERNYPTLTRGIFTRQNSHFNQDIAENMVLIELGGNYNKLSEVLNTIDILAQAIKEYIYEY